MNARGEDGIFARLSEVTPGDGVRVERADGRTAVFYAVLSGVQSG